MTEFNLETAITTANRLVNQIAQRNLNDVEITILKGAWKREEYDMIAAQHNYSTSYLSQDIAPKLWKMLSKTLGEKVRKSNFKEALRRYWQTQEKRVNSSLVSDFYVERLAVESVCCQALSQPGALLRLKGCRLLGKTSLMERVLAKMSHDGYAVVNLSLKLAEKSTHFSNLNRFLRWLCCNISKELELSNQLNKYWDEEDLGSKVSCTTYLQDHILNTLDRPLILCIDDVDLLFPYPEIYEDFFALLRSWYEKARTRKKWQYLRLALIHATDIYLRLNIYQSPFNIGLLQDLPEFTEREAKQLALKHELQLSQSDLISLLDLVGGHPYLLQKTFTLLKSNRNLMMTEILAEAATESGIYSDHLRKIWLDIQQNAELIHAISQLLISTNPVLLDPIQTYQLQNIGLVKLTKNLVELRCNLYRQFFSQYLRLEDIAQ